MNDLIRIDFRYQAIPAIPVCRMIVHRAVAVLLCSIILATTEYDCITYRMVIYRFILQQAALVHDLGELKMNREYIKSSHILTTEERLDLQRHPVIGEQEAAKLGLPRGVQLLVRWHHEWWNGGGYPDGLVGDQIPLAARILRVADTYSALVSTRPTRAAWPHMEARKYLVEWAGIEFDPAIVKAFVRISDARRQAQTVRV